MTIQDCIDFIKKNPACILSTVDGNRARGRGMVPLWVKEDGIYFTTAASKELYSQLKSNPGVELCFMTLEPLKQLRISGEVEFIRDLGLKNKALEERPFLKALGLQDEGDPNFVLFRVASGEAHFWTWEDNLKEREIPRIKY